MTTASFCSVSFYICHFYFFIFLGTVKLILQCELFLCWSFHIMIAVNIVACSKDSITRQRSFISFCVCQLKQFIWQFSEWKKKLKKKRLIKVNISPLSSVNQFKWNRFLVCSIRKVLCVTNDLDNSWVSSLSRNTWCFGHVLPI